MVWSSFPRPPSQSAQVRFCTQNLRENGARVFLAGIQDFQEWMPARYTLAAHSSRLENQMRGGMFCEGKRVYDDH